VRIFYNDRDVSTTLLFGPNAPQIPKTYEVNTDRRDVAFGVGIIGKTKQQARLSNTGVTDEEQLEKVVVSISMVRPET
jgi:hypothetical protein